MKTSYVVRAQKMVTRLFPYIECALSLYEDQQLVSHIKKNLRLFNNEKHLQIKFNYGATRGVFICADYVIKFDLGSCNREYGNCDTEYDTYLDAQDTPYEKWFAKITPYTVNGFNFWIMPRASRVGKCENWADYIDEESLNYIFERVDDLHVNNIGWLHNHPIIIDYACNFDSIPEEEYSCQWPCGHFLFLVVTQLKTEPEKKTAYQQSFIASKVSTIRIRRVR